MKVGKYRKEGSSKSTRWFKYDRDWCRQIYTQTVPVIFEPPCTSSLPFSLDVCMRNEITGEERKLHREKLLCSYVGTYILECWSCYQIFTEQSPYWIVDICLVNKEIPHISWNRLHTSPIMVLVLSRFKPVHTLPSIFRSQFNISLSSRPAFFKQSLSSGF